ncbi:superoxide dismutase [Cu-Zn] [Phlebotomus papatasi]|uniref:superoxide dismutase n=1 Tax=Phlebotomus papatasi TaxID=29031 RepID=A0A1B0DG83_PHLPP|nr:superoxide dismutase [Cu-Zn] [Phlebotomus papatasi]
MFLGIWAILWVSHAALANPILLEAELLADETRALRQVAPAREFLFLNNQVAPIWRASATLTGDNAEGGPAGLVSFRQFTDFDPVVVSINVTGLTAGKHGVHIHQYGDLTESCKSTGPHFKRSLIGNIEAKEDGTASVEFASPYLSLCGPNGIIGRSLVIHEKPIEYNRFPDIATPPSESQEDNPTLPQTEEQKVGNIVACGVISITKSKE